ncbi:hypothetical protein [Pantoea cypripedii]|uniref:hypothetical protein n=1 Tax=Pantoea cypripedii TaxID=55209 RepID=UPI001ABF3154|nr:hypothetical protein [Pantoea cypripedii]
MSNNSVSDLMNNSGAVACASETDDLAQCLAERLTQKNEDEVGRLKKRYKARDEIIGLAQPLQAKQQQENIPLSRVLMQLTVREGVAFKQAIDGASDSAVVVNKAGAKAENKTEVIKMATQGVSTADDSTSGYSAPQTKHVNNGWLMSSVPPMTATSVQSPASITANITSHTERKSQNEKSEKFPEIITPTPRVILAEHNQTLPVIENQKQATFTTETKPIHTVLQRHAESDFSPAIMTKSINIDLQADKIELHYPITDQAVVKLQLTEQAIAPASSNVRVSEMLVGQAALSNYDPGWLLHGAKQSRPYYLSLSGNDQKGKTENNLWKDREE